MKTAIDWAAKPAPWCWIGPALRQECEAIMRDQTPAFVAPKVLPKGASGPALRARRMALGLQTKAVAAMVGCGQSNVSAAELHELRPGLRRKIDALLTQLEAEQQKDAA